MSSVQYIITCTSNLSAKTLITEYDPLLLAEINLSLKNMLGGICMLTVEDFQIVAAEDCETE